MALAALHRSMRSNPISSWTTQSMALTSTNLNRRRLFVTFLPGLQSRGSPNKFYLAKTQRSSLEAVITVKVYIFDRKSGSLLDTLHHAKRGLVQTIAVSSRSKDIYSLANIWQAHQKGNRSTIASASSTIGGRNFINLWTYESGKERKQNTTSSSFGWITVLRGMLEVFMAVATVLFLIQSMEMKVSYVDRVWKSIMLTMV